MKVPGPEGEYGPGTRFARRRPWGQAFRAAPGQAKAKAESSATSTFGRGAAIIYGWRSRFAQKLPNAVTAAVHPLVHSTISKAARRRLAFSSRVFRKSWRRMSSARLFELPGLCLRINEVLH